MSLKAAFYTLGCKVNYYDTEALKREFHQEGFTIVDFKDWADVYVINTCTVTHLADRKSRQYIRRAKRHNPEALVAVTGCYAQANPAGVAALPEVDLFLGTTARLSLPQLIKKRLAGENIVSPVTPYEEKAVFEEMPFLPEQGRTRAFLKIQEGCNQFCSYCIIPLARGPLRSLPLQKGMAYLQEIGSSGFKEVVLTGIHLGLYGGDLNPPVSLAAFLKKAVTVGNIERIRLSSIEPTDFSEELISVIQAQKKICSHFHIPLQSGDDTILEKMGRPYNTAGYADLLKKLRDLSPDLAVSTDIMVGFPGEDAKHFQNSINFVRECSFSRLHVFKYSTRPGTKAAVMSPQVTPQVKDERSKAMLSLGEELSAAFQDKYPGRDLEVLFEKKLRKPIIQGNVGYQLKKEKKWGTGSYYEGLTSNYLRVHASLPSGEWRGRIGNVHIVKNSRGCLQGYLVN